MDVSILVSHADLVFMILEDDVDYRFSVHRRTRSQVAGVASTLFIRSALGNIMTPKRYLKTGQFKKPKKAVPKRILFIGHSPPVDSNIIDGSILGKIETVGQLIGGQDYTIVNLFADIVRYSKDIKGNDPTNKDDRMNLNAIKSAASNTDITVACWGSRGTIHGRAQAVVAILKTLRDAKVFHVGSLTKNGQPRHFRGWDTKSKQFQLSQYKM